MHTSEIWYIKFNFYHSPHRVLSYFRGRYGCIFNNYHQTITIATMGWNQNWLEFFMISLQTILFNSIHKKQVLSNVIDCVTRVRKAVIIAIVVYVTITINKEYIIYEYIEQLSVPFASYIAQFNPLMAIVQITRQELAGIEIYPMRWKVSNEQSMSQSVESLAYVNWYREISFVRHVLLSCRIDFLNFAQSTAVIFQSPLFPGTPVTNMDLTLIPAYMNNYINCEVRYEIIYSFPNFNGATVAVWEWISNFSQHFIGHVITYPCWD